ncbi:Nucleolar protein 12 [Apophysomyces sp. BC1034]|nr:Nucleolar protein 12 [Apophysomyces sp. BC1015]KAG0178986.1 Nucleolar protein 12 [Apophysomyces sp. BC1021]KAG0186664.1 Nucleolar protein 12 [Apophysomyces sp. BC1034]
MSTTYTPGFLSSTILGEKTGSVNNELDNMFKNSAGPSKAVEKPDLVALSKLQRVKTEKKKSKTQQKEMGKRAEEAAKKARALQALPPLERKRKAAALEASENAGAKKMAKTQETEEEKQEKTERTVFLGNVPVECSEKSGEKELKNKFREFGEIESLRFRSVAFSQLMSRKGAFIGKKLHDDRSVMNAYIVYKEKDAVEKALTMNGQLFMKKHLRVDSAATAKQHDRKRSVFLGSLPFDLEEEALWDHFKDCGEIQSVRIVRDNKTNIGKGFGYVQFKERVAVDLALALEDKRLGGKHKIRVQRCKLSVSEGGQRSKPPSKKSGRGDKPSKKRQSGKNTAALKRYEGTRATKNDRTKVKFKKQGKKTTTKHKK